MIDKELDIKDLNIGKVYRYHERDFGCTIFAEVLIRRLSFINDTYHVECDILRDLGSDPKLNLVKFMEDYLTLGYQKDNKHYFKGRFYNEVEINIDELSNEYDAEIKLYDSPSHIVEVGSPIYGHIYNDSRSRFHDGDQIHTSKVLEYNEETKIATTKNTKYKIIE